MLIIGGNKQRLLALDVLSINIIDFSIYQSRQAKKIDRQCYDFCIKQSTPQKY